MFGSAILDMVVGMVFVFLLLSLVVSAVREAIEARLQDRAKLLAWGLHELLGGGSKVLLERLYCHPLIAALYSGPFDEKIIDYRRNTGGFWILKYIGSFFFKRTKMPAYIPARTVALALLDMARNGQLGLVNPPAAGNVSAGEVVVADVRASLAAQNGSAVARALLAALAQAGGDTEKALKAIQDWYDASMDRVSGWFKRETQQILFVLGLLVAVGLNVDAVFLAKYLAADESARHELAEMAARSAVAPDMAAAIDKLRAPEPGGLLQEEPAPDTPDATAATDEKVSSAVKAVTDLGLPVGWTASRWAEFSALGAGTLRTVVGWLITAFALSFGAPFWFDLLNKLMVIRSTVKPHEKSPEEGSEDRQRKAS